MPNTLLPHAVVLGLSPTALYVARELGKRGVTLLGVDRQFACAGASKHFRGGDGVWVEPDTNVLLERLIAHAKSLDLKPVLIPTSDHYIEFIGQHYSRLCQVFLVSKSYSDKAGLLLDKMKFHQLCKEHGVATPGVWELASVQDMLEFCDVPFPCILKPTLIHLAKDYMRGKKVFIVNNRSELVEIAQHLPADSGSWLVQEVIPGEESFITLCAGYASESDTNSDTFTARKLRQYPPGFGSASRVISQSCSATRTLSVDLILAIGYRGIYGAEFKRDPRDGVLKIIEINPRPTLWFHASHASGKRLVERAYCELAGIEGPSGKPQRDGVVWHYVLKDVASAIFYRFKGGNFIFNAPDLSAGGPRKRRSWPVFSCADPAPFFVELYVYVTKLLGRLR